MGEHLFVWNVQLDLSATDKKGKKKRRQTHENASLTCTTRSIVGGAFRGLACAEGVVTRAGIYSSLYLSNNITTDTPSTDWCFINRKVCALH